MDLKTQIQNDMKEAMKAGDASKVSTLRMLISELKKNEINNRGTDKAGPLDEAAVHKTIQTMVKQRHDSIDAFTKGARPDLVEIEQRELAILKTYLPEQLSAEELQAIVTQVISETGASTPNDIGKVMKGALAKSAGRADGKLVNEIARKLLTK
jgi:uncharacterized protein